MEAVTIEDQKVRHEFGIRNTQKNDDREVDLAEHRIDELTSNQRVGADDTSIDIEQDSENAGTRGYEGIAVKSWNKEAYREERAGSVALIIAFTFAAFLFIGAGLGGAIVLRKSPEEATQLIQALTPFLESLGKSAALVFGPPLAFILGYYFRGRPR